MCDRSVFISKIGLIPQTLKLWFGDDWIFHRVVEDLKKGVIIVGSPLCHHFESQTIGKKFTGKMKQIIDVDRNEWINILEKK